MQDTSPEIEKLQNDFMSRLTSGERIRLGCEMYAAARAMIIKNMPENSTEDEKLGKIFFQMYGEHLPDDFFEYRKR